MFLIVSILLTLLIVLLCRSVKNTKLDIRDRVLHIRYVFVALVYGIVCVLLFVKILDLVNWVVSLPVIRNFLFSIIPPNNVSASFYWVITLLCCLLLSAVYLLLMHLVHALWLVPLSKKEYLETNNPLEKLFNAIAGRFYRIHDDSVKLPIVDINAGRWIRAMRRGFVYLLLAQSVLLGLYLQMDLTLVAPDVFALVVKSLYMLPVLSYFVLEQMELFLVADEGELDILIDTEEIGMVQRGSFSGLADMYEDILGGKALIARYQGSGKGQIQESLFAGVQEDQSARTDSPELLQALCRNIEFSNTLSPHYVNGVVDLINGESIAVFDTPWGEFDPYYLAYVQHRLILEDTALILCDTPLQVKRMKERLEAVFTRLNVAAPIWRIHGMNSIEDGKTDILVCTEEEFLSTPIDQRYPKFAKKLHVVIMLDSYGLLCRESAYSSRIFNYFYGKPLQYIFYIPENNPDIRHQLQEKVGCGEIHLRENPHSNGTAQLLFWRADSVYKPQLALSSRLFNDFGVGYTIAVIAGKHDASTVNVLAPESVPLQTYYHLVTQTYTTELLEDYLKTHSINLSTIIRNNDYSVTAPSELKFCIVYDEMNNLLDVAQTWLSYGGAASSMLHIISPPYMFRDYFASNVSTLCAETTGLQMLIPQKPLGQRAPAMALLLRLRRGMQSQEILCFAEENGFHTDRVEQILQIALELVFGKKHHYNVFSSFSFKECAVPAFDNGYLYTVTVTMINEKLYKTLCEMTEEFVRLTGALTDALPIHRLDIYNHFLPQQQVVFGNQRYRITSVRDGMLQVVPESSVQTELYYTPLYDIIGLKRTDTVTLPVPKNNKVVMQHFEAVVTRKTRGYYAHPGMLSLKDRDATHLETLEVPVTETKTVPCLQLEFSIPLKNRSDKVANTLCFLLKGALATFLPKSYKDLLVFSKLDMDRLREGVSFQTDSGLLPDPIPSDLKTGFDTEEIIQPDIFNLIPQVSEADVLPNTEDKFYIYIVQFSALDTGALSAITADLDRILGTILGYLTWSEAQKPGAPEYLRFGYEEVPGIFATNDTVFCLPNFFDHVPTDHASRANEMQLTGNGLRCSFCGKPVTTSYTEMDDGRIMCPQCKGHITNSRKEIKELLDKAIKTLEEHYSITLPKDIRVKFKSAATIRKVSSSASGRVLGFYNLRRREIWVERNGPEACVLSELIHELTHAWQHASIRVNVDLTYLEGHASYVEEECMRLLRQDVYADYINNYFMNDQTEYGQGYRYWKSYLRSESDKNIFNHMLKRFPKE